MLKLITLIVEIVWSICKGIAKQNEQEKAKREELKKQANEAWSSSDTRRNIDRVLSKLRR